MLNNRALTGGGIAVIIPAFNAEDYIADCLESLLAQHYTNWTAYIVNDGSTDDTGKILDEYAARDNRIKVFHTPNGGASKARNFALAQVGDEEWISFLDADDYLAPTMYSAIADAVKDQNVDYVRLFCQQTAKRYDKSELDNRIDEEIQSKVVTNIDYFLNEPVGGFICSLFVRSKIIKDNHVNFPENMRVLEDQVLSIKCATLANNIMVLESPKNYYYFSGNSNSITKQQRDTSDDIIRCVNAVYESFKRMPSADSVLKNYFYKKYLPIKLDLLCGNRLHNRKSKPNVKFNEDICIPFSQLTTRTKAKYLLTKILRIL